MKKQIIASGLTLSLALAAQAQITPPVIPPGKIAVFKAGTSDNSWPMVTARVTPVFVQVFDPASTNQSSTNALVSVAMSTNSSVPGSVWINHHAGSEGGGLSRSIDRRYLALEGYTGNILSPTSAKPSTDQTVNRGIVTLDAFTNATDIYSSTYTWFGIPAGAASGTQDNPTGIASMDGTNFWGTGNFAGVSGELDGTLFYNPGINLGHPVEVQNYVQAAGEARIIGGTLYVATKAAAGVASGIYNFVDQFGSVVPLPWDPNVPTPYFNYASTNLFINWGNTFQNILNFDMNPSATVAYGADQTYGIVKFTNNAGTWVQAPYYFSTTNIGTTAQTAGNQGCFGICVDFSGANPVIYATTMENGAPANYVGGVGVNTKQGHQNNNRLIKIVDTGVNPGTSYVATTLAIAATTNEFFGGIDFTPDLRPLIASQPANYGTFPGGGAVPFSLTVQSAYTVSNQWFIVGTNSAYPHGGTNLIAAETGTTISDLNADFTSGIDISFNNNFVFCIVTNDYGAVTSAPAILTVTAAAAAPVTIGSTNNVNGFVNGSATLTPIIAAGASYQWSLSSGFATFSGEPWSGTQPFSYQWYYGTNQLADGSNPNFSGSGYSGSQTPTLTVTNLQLTDAGNYNLVVSNPAGFTSNLVEVLAVNYHVATISAGQPQSVTTFLGVPTSLTASEVGATEPVTSQWFSCNLVTAGNIITNSVMLSDTGDFTGSATPTLNIAASTTNDAGHYYIVYSNPGGSVTSAVALVTIAIPPPHSFVSYTNQIYLQTFDGLPDPGGVSVNSINNPKDPGTINGVAYSLANPFDFAYPVILTSFVGGLGLSTGANNLNGWYGAADTNNADAGPPDGITRFGAQAGDQSTGGVIDFGPLDVNGGIVGTNRSLGLISTSTTGATSFGLKLINNSGTNLNYINLSFIGEFWRNNKAARTMSFSYTIDPTTTNFVLGYQPVATNTEPQDITNTISVPNLAFNFLTNDGSILAMDGTQPSNQVYMVTNNMALSTPWPTNGALWLIWSINYYGQGTGQGYSIDNLNVSGTVVPTTVPLATTLAATKITATNAQFNATINPSNGPTAYWFNYGTTASYGKSTATNNLGVVSGPASVASLVNGLLPGTLYHYQIVATNIAGTSFGVDQTFTTVAKPTVATLTVSNITASSATLDATVNPNGAATAYWFKYGTTTSYGSLTATNSVGSGSSPVTVTNLISGLLQGTVYHYQIVATNLAGLVTNVDANFTTLVVTPPQLGSVIISAVGGAFHFSFTNATGASFSVLATNNLTIPATNWPVIGHPIESPAGSGNYQFTNSSTANLLYYRLRQP